MVKVDFATADLGRHLKNGEIILNGTAEARNAVLHTNFYSYTEPNFPFVNHHWGSGVIFYLTEKISGFNGLSLLYLVFSLATFWIFFKLACEKSGLLTVSLISMFAIPIIASRAEIRPEIFTYFFCGVFLYICKKIIDGRISPYYLLFLPIFQLIWVNLHTGFIFGPFIVGTYAIDLLIRKYEARALVKRFIVILIFIIIAIFINPSGVKGALLPFTIFSNYGYKIVENQSIPFLVNLGVGNRLAFTQYEVLLALTILTFGSMLLLKRKEIDLPQMFFTIVFATMSFLAIRYFPLFGFFAIPAVSLASNQLYGSFDKKILYTNKVILIKVLMSLLLIFSFIFTLVYISKNKGRMGIGLAPGSDAAASFFKTNLVRGPILNNYDIGGYLIYYLYPEKVFYDNRPEAYSTSFSQDIYVASLQDDNLFKKIDEEYVFNSIFFYYRDYTPWGQAFLTRMIYDSDWAPVFVDDKNLILLRRNEQNRSIIEKYEIPKEVFQVRGS